MMTFKDEYRKEMDQIEPSDAFARRLGERLQAEVDHPTASSPRAGRSSGGVKRRRTIVGLTVAAACLVLLLCGGTFLRLMLGGASNAMPMDYVAGQSSSSAAYSACDDRTKYGGPESSSESMLAQSAEGLGDKSDATADDAIDEEVPESDKLPDPNMAMNPETGGSDAAGEENPNTSINPNTGGSGGAEQQGAYVEGYWCDTGADYFVRYFDDPSDVVELDCYEPASLDNAVSKLTLTVQETETFAVALYNAETYYLDAAYAVYLEDDQTVRLDTQSMLSIRVLLRDHTAFRLNLYEEGYVVAPYDSMVFVPDEEAFGLVWSQCQKVLGR